MIYLLNDKKLPWSNFKNKFKGHQYTFEEYVIERASPIYMTELIDMAPKTMHKMIKRLITLEFEEEPPYDELINLILSHLSQEV